MTAARASVRISFLLLMGSISSCTSSCTDKKPSARPKSGSYSSSVLPGDASTKKASTSSVRPAEKSIRTDAGQSKETAAAPLSKEPPLTGRVQATKMPRSALDATVSKPRFGVIYKVLRTRGSSNAKEPPFIGQGPRWRRPPGYQAGPEAQVHRFTEFDDRGRTVWYGETKTTIFLWRSKGDFLQRTG